MVEFSVSEKNCKGLKVSVMDNGKEVGRAYLYLMYNDLHKRPFGFVEDVFIDESFRGDGIGKDLMKQIVDLAKENNCYKMIFTSRFVKEKLHSYYERQGFTKHGFEFRIDF